MEDDGGGKIKSKRNTQRGGIFPGGGAVNIASETTKDSELLRNPVGKVAGQFWKINAN